MSETPLNISGDMVRRLRSRLGLSQPELAVRCQLAGWDIERDTIAKIEGGTRVVRDTELVRLAYVLGVTANDLVNVKVRKEAPRPAKRGDEKEGED